MREAPAAKFQMKIPDRICEHFDYSRTELNALICAKRIRNVSGILARYGRGSGCCRCRHEIAEMVAQGADLTASVRKPAASGWSPQEVQVSREEFTSPLPEVLEQRYAPIRCMFPWELAYFEGAETNARAHYCDVGIVCLDDCWRLFVCGQKGKNRRRGQLLAAGQNVAALVRCIDRFLMYYIATADGQTRAADWCDTLEGGIDHLRELLIVDKLGICSELDDLFQHLGRERKRVAAAGTGTAAIRSPCVYWRGRISRQAARPAGQGALHRDGNPCIAPDSVVEGLPNESRG